MCEPTCELCGREPHDDDDYLDWRIVPFMGRLMDICPSHYPANPDNWEAFKASHSQVMRALMGKYFPRKRG